MRIGISRRSCRSSWPIASGRETAVLWFDLLDDKRGQLDRAIRDLEAGKEERDEAMALVRPHRLPSNEESASSVSSTAHDADKLTQIWAVFADLEKRVAETDKRIEDRKEAIARLIERIEILQKRPLRYC